MTEEEQIVAWGLADGKVSASSQLVFLPARAERSSINAENLNLSEQFVAMSFLRLPLNGAIHYRNIMHSKPLSAHDNSSGLGRNRTMFDCLSSAVTCCSVPTAKNQNCPYKERECQN